MTEIPWPDHSERPLKTACERLINAAPKDVFEAWTTRFDAWFAQPGTLVLTAEAGRPYFFYNRDDWGRHPHYGRILELQPDQRLVMTWLTGDGTQVGTQGAETVLRIDLEPEAGATRLRLEHSGFASETSRDGHAENWPLALDILADAIGG